MKDFLKSLGSALLISFMIILFFFVGSGVSQRFTEKHTGFFGIGYANVPTGSMEPNIHVGDMIIFQSRPMEDYEVNDVIVYVRDEGEESEKLIVHRIVEITDGQIITKGDANQESDNPKRMGTVVGRVVFRIPVIGLVADFIKTPVGFLCVAAFIVVIIIINLIVIAVMNRRHPIKTVNGESFIEY